MGSEYAKKNSCVVIGREIILKRTSDKKQKDRKKKFGEKV